MGQMAVSTSQLTWRILAMSAVSASLTGTLVETALATITVPAGAMGANGIIRVSSVWSYTNSANSKTLRLKFGSTTGPTSAFTATAAAPLNCIIGNRNSVSSQFMGLGTGLFGSTTTANLTAAQNTANAVDITLNGTLANTGETITLETYIVELAYRA